MEFEAVIGVEAHVELATRSKMFCACPVVDTTQAPPNTAVCPVCAGMPGVLPVVNRRAVEYALRVALALECEISLVSIFARKNYFYPDLPKGYQISQYEQPLARNGQIKILSVQGERTVRIRRVHLEEDTGKLTHVSSEGQAYSLVDLNRAGVPLLEIVTEPDMRSAEEVRAYAVTLRSLLVYLGVNSGDLEKGVLRLEPNVSVHPVGSRELGTRVEIKNLNSFRALERSIAYEIQRQTDLLRRGERVFQETRGWDEDSGVTFLQRRKEREDDYRYFPEPDLPPLVIDPGWLAQIQAELPELPHARLERFKSDYGLSDYDAGVLTVQPAVSEYFEQVVKAASDIEPKVIAHWVTGELFSLLKQADREIEEIPISSQALAELIHLTASGTINQNTARLVLAEMFSTGKSAGEIVAGGGLEQISDEARITEVVRRVLTENPHQVKEYLSGKLTVKHWLFGQVMRATGGLANPHLVKGELDRQLDSQK